MKTLYLIRHGETEYNKQHLFQGWCDSPLTENGIHQAETAALWFQNNQIVFDHAYASALERTHRTIEILTDLPYECSANLNENYLGEMEEKSISLLNGADLETFFVPYGGESWEQVADRMSSYLESVMEKEDHKNVLAVSSLLSCRYFLRRYQDYAATDKLSFANCTIYILEYENHIFRLKDVIIHDFDESK